MAVIPIFPTPTARTGTSLFSSFMERVENGNVVVEIGRAALEEVQQQELPSAPLDAAPPAIARPGCDRRRRRLAPAVTVTSRRIDFAPAAPYRHLPRRFTAPMAGW